MISLLDRFIESAVNFLASLGYPGIFLGMAIESSFFPFPSELIMIPAGVFVASGKISFFWAFVLGVLGSLFGALINYFLAATLGKAIISSLIERFGKFLFLSKRSIEKSERFFLKHGEVATFVGRLIPGIRQVISLPAGFSKMNIKRFIIFTSLGAGIWIFILLYVGVLLGNNQQWILDNKGLISVLVMSFAFIVLIVYALLRKRRIFKSTY